MDNLIIENYNEKYAKDISNIILDNLFKINIKDYGIEYIEKFSEEFKEEPLNKILKKRTKVYVALQNSHVVGTAGLDKSWYNNDGEYWILSVFVKIENHGQGIGKKLVQTVENYAKQINVKKLVIPSCISATEFYYKLGYNYPNGKKELNPDKMYIMEKSLLH